MYIGDGGWFTLDANGDESEPFAREYRAWAWIEVGEKVSVCLRKAAKRPSTPRGLRQARERFALEPVAMDRELGMTYAKLLVFGERAHADPRSDRPLDRALLAAYGIRERPYQRAAKQRTL